MTERSSAAPTAPGPAVSEGSRELIPRYDQQGYDDQAIAARRDWLAAKCGVELDHVAAGSLAGPSLRGNVENPIGIAQVPLGVAGPLWVRGERAVGTYYVPLATTEGALVRSYERGAVALTRSGGANARVLHDTNRVSPVFTFDDLPAAAHFARLLPTLLAELAARASTTTRHGRLLRVEPLLIGRRVIAHFVYSTGDAHGMNMIVAATDAACRLLVEQGHVARYLVLSGAEGEKRAAGSLFAGGKGKHVTAAATLPARICRGYLHADPRELVEVWRATSLGHLVGATMGYNGHLANGLTALYIACGQDVANVVNAAVGITQMECLESGDLHASVTLPALTVATVGGGTALGTARECLDLLGCFGAGGAVAFAEITAALLLGGELSMAGALASGEFVAAHESYGRNRPAPSAGAGEPTSRA